MYPLASSSAVSWSLAPSSTESPSTVTVPPTGVGVVVGATVVGALDAAVVSVAAALVVVAAPSAVAVGSAGAVVVVVATTRTGVDAGGIVP